VKRKIGGEMIFIKNIYLLSSIIMVTIPSLSYGIDVLEKRDNAYLLGIAQALILEKSVLNSLEEHIYACVNGLDPALKRYMTDWKTGFEKLKKKIDILQPYVDKYRRFLSCYALDETMAALMEDGYFFKGEPFLYVLLGLKPVTVITNRGLPLKMWQLLIKAFDGYLPLRLLEDLYPQEMMLGSVDFVGSSQKSDIGHFAACLKPLFPLPFIYACYKHTIELSEEFTEHFIWNCTLSITNIRQYIGDIKNIDSPTFRPDDYALLLGLQPTILKRVLGNLDVTHRVIGGMSGEKNFRYLVLPGVVSLKDDSPYMMLYSKVMEYVWIRLFGTQEYLYRLGSAIKGIVPDVLQVPSSYYAYTLLKGINNTDGCLS
jgi:hypothetical protein